MLSSRQVIKETMMAILDLRPGCECCDRDLPPESTEATICSFECTFCAACAEAMGGICKNCGGNLVPRPIRPPDHLEANPPTADRTHNPGGCPTTRSADIGVSDEAP